MKLTKSSIKGLDIEVLSTNLRLLEFMSDRHRTILHKLHAIRPLRCMIQKLDVKVGCFYRVWASKPIRRGGIYRLVSHHTVKELKEMLFPKEQSS